MRRITPLLLLAAACRQESVPVPAAVNRAAFEKEIADYRKTRVERLTRPEGWLSVVALIPLQAGANDVEIPSKPPVHARITLAGGKVTLDANPFVVDLGDDTQEGYTTVRHGAISFFIHKVGDNFGV